MLNENAKNWEEYLEAYQEEYFHVCTMFYSEVLEMKPIVYLAAYGGKWYSAKLNKAHTILINSYVIFRVLSNMPEYLGKKWTLPGHNYKYSKR